MTGHLFQISSARFELHAAKQPAASVVKVGRNGPERRSACSPNSGEAFRLLMLDGNAAERLIIGSFKWVNG